MGRDMQLMRYQRELTDRLGTGKDHWQLWCGEGADWHQFALRQFQAPQIRLRTSKVTMAQARQSMRKPVTGAPVSAWVQRSRWVATCECAGQEVVDPANPQFYCFGCFNVDNGGAPRPVIFPAQAKTIERVLMLRPDPFTRNWLVTETVADLQRENRENDVPDGGKI